jgi:hypothetical protein
VKPDGGNAHYSGGQLDRSSAAEVVVSEESRIYGCIVGPHGSTADWYGLYPLNYTVIESLVTDDDYPPLTRGMFAVPMDFGQPGSAFYREQMIHFGASFNHLSESWHLWLAKFEGLLRRLYWSEARLHLQTELHGAYDYRWWAAYSGTPPWLRSPPAPTAEWTFEGGQRDFRATGP